MKGILKYIGRDYDKYNCFDLVKEFYLDFYNLDLKNYWESAEVPERWKTQNLIVSSKGDFDKVTEPKQGDIVVVNLFGYSCHVGIFIEQRFILHSLRKIGSCIEPTKKYERMIEGYYRHRVIE